jgi:hypothetical protein
VSLIARDNRPAVNTPKRGTSGNPVRRTTSEKGRTEELNERAPTGA